MHGLSSRGRHLDWCESCVLKELVGSVLRAIGLVLGSSESASVVVVLEEPCLEGLAIFQVLQPVQ